MEEELERLKREVANLKLELERAKKGDAFEDPPSQPSLVLERQERSSPRTPQWGKSPASPYSRNAKSLRNVDELKSLTSGESGPEESRGASRLPQVQLPVFEGKSFNEWCGSFTRWVRLAGVDKLPDKMKRDWLVEAMSAELKNSVAYLSENCKSFGELVERLEELFPETETDAELRLKVVAYPSMKREHENTPDRMERYLIGFDTLLSNFTDEAITEQDAVMWLTSKMSDELFSKCRATHEDRRRCDGYESLKGLIREKVRETVLENLIKSQRGGVPKPSPNLAMTKVVEPDPKKKNVFKSSIICHFCGKKGHYRAECWHQNPALKPSKPRAPPKNQASPKPPPKQNRQAESTPVQENAPPPQPVPYPTPTGAPFPVFRSPEPMETPKFQSKKRKQETMHLLKSSSVLTLSVEFHGQPRQFILDTGASLSAISSSVVKGTTFDQTHPVPVKVGYGDTIWSLGSLAVDIPVGKEVVNINCLVLDTDAFQAILGMDFLRSPKVRGLMMNPPALLIGEDKVPLQELESDEHTNRLFRTFRTESYTLEPKLRRGICQIGNMIDLFASDVNCQADVYCTKQGNSAWRYSWRRLGEESFRRLWINPPFTKIHEALTKVALEKAKALIVTPKWKTAREGEHCQLQNGRQSSALSMEKVIKCERMNSIGKCLHLSRGLLETKGFKIWKPE